MTRLTLLSIPTMCLALACGNPEVSLQDALNVVYISVDGAADVQVGMSPEVFFSGAVEQQSATSQHIFLLHAAYEQDESNSPACGSDWLNQGISVSFPADANEPDHMLRVKPVGDLTAGHCYALILTTAVKGRELGPLENLGLCDQASGNPNADLCASLQGAGAGDPPRVGAFAFFRVSP